MNAKEVFRRCKERIHDLLSGEASHAQSLWSSFTRLHSADIADFLTDLDTDQFRILFARLDRAKRFSVFQYFSNSMRIVSLSLMSDHDKADALNSLPSDELADLLDFVSDEDLKIYLGYLHKKPRERVLSLMKFHPESAGGIMDVEIFPILEDFTVEQVVRLIQRLQPSREIHPIMYVTDRRHRLLGHIRLEDLVLQRPNVRISSFMRSNEFVARAEQDREFVAQQMVHYGLMMVPVVGTGSLFLGIIPSDTLVDVLVEEASEDLQKMSALVPLKTAYFETAFSKILFERSSILIALLIAQSFSAKIMQSYESTLQIGSLWLFVTTLISAGGNSSNQTSAVMIQGIASGEIRPTNLWRYLRREVLMAAMLALILGVVGFARAFLTTKSIWESVAISTSLTVIVFVAVTLGCAIPILLKRINIDPAFSAGPFLATLMDILGVLIFCWVSKLIFSLG